MIYCLFEQSGTFKKIAQSYGYCAIDVDLENRFCETDLQIDLFAAIDKLPNGFLANITPNDLILAFYPCTWFCDFNMLLLTGKAVQMKNWSDEKKAEYIKDRKAAQTAAITRLKKLIEYCKANIIPLVIENPVSHYIIEQLGNYTIAHKRSTYGDFYDKRTLYYCYNCNINIAKLKPIYETPTMRITKARGIWRSLMSPTYAENLFR